MPHVNRLALAVMLGLDPERIHLFEGHVGGGFGIRGELAGEASQPVTRSGVIGNQRHGIDRRLTLATTNAAPCVVCSTSREGWVLAS